MSDGYASIADTEHVREAQVLYGSRAAQARSERHGPPATGPEPRDPLTPDEQEFISARDGFYLASVSDTGWPYVQFRGGPPGFVRCPNEHTIAWADFRGNRQYISAGNVTHDERVALFFMDYPNRGRLKVYGRARIVDARGHPELIASLAVPGYRAVVERAVSVTVVSYDWNCAQHITPRYTAAELNAILGPSWQRPLDAYEGGDEASP
jgi:predicted pyridoxine 5'-phosphate oxidase superfamily flavin-nucleotide-binding protein